MSENKNFSVIFTFEVLATISAASDKGAERKLRRILRETEELLDSKEAQIEVITIGMETPRQVDHEKANEFLRFSIQPVSTLWPEGGASHSRTFKSWDRAEEFGAKTNELLELEETGDDGDDEAAHDR